MRRPRFLASRSALTRLTCSSRGQTRRSNEAVKRGRAAGAAGGGGAGGVEAGGHGAGGQHSAPSPSVLVSAAQAPSSRTQHPGAAPTWEVVICSSMPLTTMARSRRVSRSSPRGLQAGRQAGREAGSRAIVRPGLGIARHCSSCQRHEGLGTTCHTQHAHKRLGAAEPSSAPATQGRPNPPTCDRC